jgi:hypothetical protein
MGRVHALLALLPRGMHAPLALSQPWESRAPVERTALEGVLPAFRAHPDDGVTKAVAMVAVPFHVLSLDLVSSVLLGLLLPWEAVSHGVPRPLPSQHSPEPRA